MNKQSAVKLFLVAILMSLNASAASYSTTIYAPNGLYQGDTLISANGKYRLMLQHDGNLVVSRIADNAVIWANYAFGTTLVVVQPDGNFVAYNTSTNPTAAVWNSGTWGQAGTGPSPVHLVLYDDGSLKLWNTSGSQIWSTLADTSCPGGAKQQLFTVCVGDRFTTVIPACSWSDALTFALQYGTYVYAGYCANGR